MHSWHQINKITEHQKEVHVHVKKIMIVGLSFLISFCCLPNISIAQEDMKEQSAESLLDEHDMSDSGEQMFDSVYESDMNYRDELVDDSDEIY
ncbi:MAG: hypothetical protein Q8Q33_05575 [Chlamydiota bacterium]|nr:hypothetical protein [Chlamydiota bacterium]